MAEPAKSYTFELDEAAMLLLDEYAANHGWELGDAPYCRWKCKLDGVSLAAYLSGKLTVQGKKAHELVEFVLEPEVLWKSGVYEFGGGSIGEPEVEFSPHGGIDESGKGDFFGPLVVAGCYVDGEAAARLLALGVKDSKAIKNDTKILAIADKIRTCLPRRYNVVTIGPEAYNRLYTQMGNLNKLLAWGHARVIENLCVLAPDAERMLSDKFGNEALIKRALMQKGRNIVLEQRVRAESDVAVAAASILAREGFVRAMDKLGRDFGVTLPKGASAKVNECARVIAEKQGIEALGRCAKVHFKTFEAVKLAMGDTRK